MHYNIYIYIIIHVYIYTYTYTYIIVYVSVYICVHSISYQQVGRSHSPCPLPGRQIRLRPRQQESTGQRWRSLESERFEGPQLDWLRGDSKTLSHRHSLSIIPSRCHLLRTFCWRHSRPTHPHPSYFEGLVTVWTPKSLDSCLGKSAEPPA